MDLHYMIIICILPHLNVTTVIAIIDPIVSGCSLISKLASRAIQKCQCEEVRIFTLCFGLSVRLQTLFLGWEGYFFAFFGAMIPKIKEAG